MCECTRNFSSRLPSQQAPICVSSQAANPSTVPQATHTRVRTHTHSDRYCMNAVSALFFFSYHFSSLLFVSPSLSLSISIEFSPQFALLASQLKQYWQSIEINSLYTCLCVCVCVCVYMCISIFPMQTRLHTATVGHVFGKHITAALETVLSNIRKPVRLRFPSTMQVATEDGNILSV